MSDMGTFRTSIAIENPARRGELRPLTEVLVDTGSELTWIPRRLLEELGIAAERRYRFVLADGRVLEREVGYAIVHVEGGATVDDVAPRCPFARGTEPPNRSPDSATRGRRADRRRDRVTKLCCKGWL